jgi:hypothetical protein
MNETSINESLDTDTTGAKAGKPRPGKVTFITGAARGIGRATPVAFPRLGVDVVGIDSCATVYPPSSAEATTKPELVETGKRVCSLSGRWQARK